LKRDFKGELDWRSDAIETSFTFRAHFSERVFSSISVVDIDLMENSRVLLYYVFNPSYNFISGRIVIEL
jgi:hypothetical protein